MRAQANRDGFVLVELLIDAVAVIALVAMPAMFAFQSASQALGASESRDRALYDALSSDLQNLLAYQAIHYADESGFASSEKELSFTSSEGVHLSIVASSVGWSAVATHEGLGEGEGCAIYVGAVFAPTTPASPTRPGEVACTE